MEVRRGVKCSRRGCSACGGGRRGEGYMCVGGRGGRVRVCMWGGKGGKSGRGGRAKVGGRAEVGRGSLRCKSVGVAF